MKGKKLNDLKNHLKSCFHYKTIRHINWDIVATYMWPKIYSMNSIPDEGVLLFDSKDVICQNNQFNLSFIFKS